MKNKTRAAKLYITLFFVAFAHNTNAQSFVPSDDSCQYYRDLEAAGVCPEATYFGEAETMCEHYLSIEPRQSVENVQFFRKVRLCLQVELNERLNPEACEKIVDIAVESHVRCYIENGFCELNAIDKFDLFWVSKSRVFKSPWLQTSEKINLACLKHEVGEVRNKAH